MFKTFWINKTVILLYLISEFYVQSSIITTNNNNNNNKIGDSVFIDSQCYITNNGKELICRNAGFKSVDQILTIYLLSSSPPSTLFYYNITKIDLSNNNITYIPTNAFYFTPNVQLIFLRKNRLDTIHGAAFKNLSNLKVLELDDNCLHEIPEAIQFIKSLEDLSLSNNKIHTIRSDSFLGILNLKSLDLRANPIAEIHPEALQNHTKLRKLILSNTHKLSQFPNLNGTTSLEVLKIDRASLKTVPDDLCIQCPKLKSLDMKSNLLSVIPNLTNCYQLRLLDLANNVISSISGQPFSTLNYLHDLLLSNNIINRISPDAFVGLSRLQILDLENNKIESIHSEAFQEMKRLEDLNLGNNIFPTLPILGLSNVIHLKTFNNPELKEFPSPDLFPKVKTMILSYAYHCCSFLTIELDDDETITKNPLKESIYFPTDDEFDINLWNSSFTDVWPQYHNLSSKFGSQLNELWNNFGSDFTYPGNMPAYVEDYWEDNDATDGDDAKIKIGQITSVHIQCLPQPGPFLPCQDLFDWWTLRCGVWVVFLLAMLGNGTVVFVIIFARSKLDVPRFLVCNLAAADFFMGIYLGLLAVVDASTLGEFRKYAIPWQMSVGCQLAGFLGVLSSELSVYTLAVITLERNYAITHAMHLNKRLSLKHASYIMSIGWIFALSMATLPLFGVSDYRKYSICLPFEITDITSLCYVVFLMLINGVAFLILMGCYLKMYCAIRGSQAWNSNDSRIAKRMALLVFTDFLCWSPIAFFTLTATFGLQLISLEQAKIFAVFVLPLNSCCNPFLYAILTKQFKKDCVLICKAIEESRVTRGIGRCRHSSNFSNRHTPANTNSLVDNRSSRDNNNQPVCPCNSRLLQNNVDYPTSTSKTTATTMTTTTITTATATTTSTNSATITDISDVNHRVRSRFHWNCKLFWSCANPQATSSSSSSYYNHTNRRNNHRRNDEYAYQIAEIQQKQKQKQKQKHKRTSSVSSSENFSSSRSDSWRQAAHHHCGIPLKLLENSNRRVSSSWIITRKPSQDSTLSSSRNDSSGSGTTASTSTSTWRISRSNASLDLSSKNLTSRSTNRSKPRLTRQMAIQEPESPDSPAKLAVRLLATIPSVAETSDQIDDEDLTKINPHDSS